MNVNAKRLFAFGTLIAFIIVLFYIFPVNNASSHIIATVKKGPFSGIVHSSGQLQAENSVSILAPAELSAQHIRLDDIKITSLIEEGTAVDSGDFVATLDHAAVESIRKTAQENLDKALGELEDAKVDTGINLSNLRDDLLDAHVILEEKMLIAEQSIYESPSVQRQAKLEVERAKRSLDQKQRSYTLKVKQEAHKVFRVSDKYRREQNKIQNINQLFQALEIKAPSAGIVIYSYNRMGQKIKVGSKISRYSPQIAELPDLRTMISTTFINEIDISKIKVGQQVKVGVDAFPAKQLDGEVISVANIGNIIPGGDAKVFEVRIRINGYDKQLKPGMTSSNQITTQTFENVTYIPIEAVFVDNDISYVYLDSKTSFVKQEIKISDENDNYCVVNQGLNEGQRILLNHPEKADKLKFKLLPETNATAN